ncbi:MFS transporter [Rhizobium leguminosarum bv. viciae]|nr:MFS transporter [Rhizobium leguminosarum bv. viciae]
MHRLRDVCARPAPATGAGSRPQRSSSLPAVGWAVGPLIGIAAGAAHQSGAFSKTPTSAPLLESLKAAIRDPRLAFFVGGGTLLIAVYGQWSATLAPYLTGHVAEGMEIYAYLVSINGAVVLIGNPFARRFIERAGALNGLVIGCVLIAFGEIGFLSAAGFWGLAAAMVVFTIGEILVVPCEYILVDGISNDRNRGSYFGAHSFSTIGNFIGPTLGGAMLGAFGGPGMFLLFAGFAAVTAVLFVLGTRMPPPKTAAPVSLASSRGATTAPHLRGFAIMRDKKRNSKGIKKSLISVRVRSRTWIRRYHQGHGTSYQSSLGT